MMNLVCQVPEPTLEQCRTWLVNEGYSQSSSRRGPEGLWSVWTHPDDPEVDTETTLYEGTCANWSEYVAGWIERMAEEQVVSPEAIYREIMDQDIKPHAVFVVMGYGPSGFGVIGVSDNEDTAKGLGIDFVRGGTLESGHTYACVSHKVQ